MNLTQQGSKSVIAAQGDVDLSNSWCIRSLAEDAIFESTNDIIIDLSRAHFIDSSAVQEMVRVWKMAGRIDRDLTIRVGVGSQPQRIIDMLLFDSGLHIEYSAG